ncbi:cytochrome P450 [Rhodococcus sp. KBS0724]|uniref:cytochrome P450 n=1 Tax=Rhodococcus sp. KBS0724 TaxID=1179674 RepID=UPI00110E4CD9|nr:cytochrome P450 [Rhodococcus sp. KBS0724]TSD47089.1 cytochrome P450 [Rhodococcus sp. KBS0724]
MSASTGQESSVSIEVPPHPPRRVPILGDIIGLDPVKPMQNTARILASLGPIYQRRILTMRLSFIGGVDLAEDVNDEKLWQKNLARPLRQLRPISGDGLFTAENDEPNWAKAHAILMPGFTQAAMRGYHNTMLDVVTEMAEAWDKADAPVDVSEEMSKLTLETIGRAGFGYRFNSYDRHDVDPFVTAMLGALEYIQQKGLPIPGRALFDRRRRRRHGADVEYLNSVVDRVIEDRHVNSPDRPDLLTLMLESVDPETGERLDPVNIRYQILTFLVAGHETSAGALSFALWLLSQHPEEASKARAEVDALWPSREIPAVEFDQVGKLRAVRRVLDETLRLWPTAPGYFREAKEDTLIGGKYAFQKGDWVMVVLQRVHRDKTVWGADADEFRPDRFLPEQVRSRSGAAYKPFGTGPRACIGRQFAYHEMLMALAVILHRYEFTADPTYELEVQEQLTMRPSGFTVTVTRR